MAWSGSSIRPGRQQGELKDDALRALFAGLQGAGRGLCLVTTREPIADLAATRDTTTPEWRLDHLTDAAGAAVLGGHGVIGPQAELEAASREVKGHALTLALALMGRYLRLAFDPPDIARRDCFGFGDADVETSELREGKAHAFRVIAAYERWFESEGRHVEAAILRLLGLFDRPATPDCLAALCAARATPGLTEPLVGLGERQWNIALQRLRELDLIETAEWVPVSDTPPTPPASDGSCRASGACARRSTPDPAPWATAFPPVPQRDAPDHKGVGRRIALGAPAMRPFGHAAM